MASPLDNKLNQYKPVDDSFSSQEFNRSYWFVTHKVVLRNLGIAAWIVADFLLIAYALSGFIQYFATGQLRDEAMIAELAGRLQAPTVNRIKSQAATPLDYGDGRVYVFDAGTDHYDFAAEVQNSNKDWYALVTYQFDVAGAEPTETRTAFLLPGEKKYLTVLGEKRPDQAITDATLKVTNTMWSRIDDHQIPDTQQFITDHESFDIRDPTFISAGSITSTDTGDNTGNRITFTITNKSAYNFWAVPVQIALMRGGALEGIEETQIKELKTGEKRSIDLRNYVKNQLADDVVVIPSVDVFDKSVYMMQ